MDNTVSFIKETVSRVTMTQPNIQTFIHMVHQFESDVIIHKNNRQTNAKSLLGLVAAFIHEGDEITIVTTGQDAKEALQAVGDFFLGKTTE
ncbi:HPr family phosphocarrier protein [Bacillaceae bacterium SIJ1]|uniref:HPr family phosphocarrier protein n=1 Tax=Litoribacterium kuwaitense TaxID=1398745 RepID=UPI0013ED849E|nr:HPr family phosphocarrier protein [Litoribacterium kuwaitense]NGP44300.1 HPr family phosphocarrier protein [Litoribacterium kuwaitense]